MTTLALHPWAWKEEAYFIEIVHVPAVGRTCLTIVRYKDGGDGGDGGGMVNIQHQL